MTADLGTLSLSDTCGDESNETEASKVEAPLTESLNEKEEEKQVPKQLTSPPSLSQLTSGPEQSSSSQSKCRADFLFLEELGEGSFSTVFLASEVKTSRKFAIKVCYKQQIMREKKVAQIFREKEILSMLSTKENAHPFIIQLFCTFQDKDSLYFVLTLAARKDLLQLMKKHKQNRLTVDQCRQVGAELLSGMGHMHRFKVVHRDLKPENILIKDDGHIMISDFGCAKRLDEALPKNQDKETAARRSSFVGTSHYVSPEVLNGVEVKQTCDYWALGVILFEMLANGRRPFHDVSEYLMYKRILKLLYAFDEGFPVDEDARNLITSLLVLEPNERLGSEELGGEKAVKEHNFFKTIEWDKLSTNVSLIL